MPPKAITPTGIERHFADDEIIVSKTNKTGHLTYVNDVFVRISGFEESELIGQPHNVIRHPSMPRSIFQLLWDRIQGGKELFAYVVNLSADGGHYWVLAHVTPTLDEAGSITGYHSNRRTASASARAVIEPLYARLAKVEEAQGKRSEAVRAGTQVLDQELAERGQTYDEFVWSLENDTMEAAA